MRGFLYATAAAVAIGSACSAAGAQSSSSVQGTGQDARTPDTTDIIVTARRTDERLQDVPISITVFNQRQLAQRNIVTPSDLATYTPSLSINGQFGLEKSSFIIRGFTQELGTSPSVGTYFADVVTPRAAGGTTSGTPAGNFFDLQNVQILKGPQGTLFGRNTTGGAVLLVPQKPTARFEGYVEGTIGNYDMRRVQGVINIPIAEALRVRFGVDRNKRDGYLRNRGTGPDLNDLDYTALRLSIVADITPDLENYTIGTYSRSSTYGVGSRLVGCDRQYLTPTGPAAQIFQRTIVPLACAQLDRINARGDKLTETEEYNPDPFFKAKTWQAINTTTWRASDTLTVKNIISYSEYRERDRFSLFGDNFLTAQSPTLGAIPFIVLNPAPGRNNAAQSTFTEELQVQGRAFDDRLNWQAGGYVEVSHPLGFSASNTSVLLRCTNLAARQCSTPPEFGPLGAFFGSLGSSFTKTYFNNKGLYAQGTYKLTDQFAVTAGLRYTIDRTRAVAENTTNRFPTANIPVQTCANTLVFRSATGGALVVNDRAQCRFGAGTKSERPTWLIDVEYKPIEDTLLYAKYSRGYRQGSVNLSNIGLETWRPEKVDTYEIGSKSTFRGALAGTLNVTGFYNDFRDQQIQGNLVNKPGTPMTGGTAIINAGKSRIWGVEVDGSVTPFTGFRVDLGYAYLNTKLLRIAIPVLSADSPFSAINPTAIVGDPLSYSPKNRVTLTGNYTLPLDSGVGQVAVGATYTYTAAQNAIARTASPFYRLPATNLLNLNLDWNGVLGQPVDLALFVTNATNRHYPIAAGGGWLFAGLQSYNVGAPRMFGARLRYRFGD